MFGLQTLKRLCLDSPVYFLGFLFLVLLFATWHLWMITEQIETNTGALFFQVYLAPMQVLEPCFS